jgi:hypothetical protein
MFMFDYLKVNKVYNKLNVEYPLLTYQDSIEGVVVSKFYAKSIGFGFKESISTSFVQIGSLKYQIHADEFGAVTRHGINEILVEGDSIMKKTNTDSVFIKKRNGKKYLMIRRDNQFLH